MKNVLVCILTATALIGGCNTNKQLPRELVFVPDMSASIDLDARRQMFAAIEDKALHLHRGDTLTIIPITGNAEAELQGHTLRYSVPSIENRQAYDADLRKLDVQIKGDLERLQADAVAYPGKHTDIIGSIRVAMKEFSGGVTDKRLIILSDFIQDDAQFNFKSDTGLLSNPGSTKIATNAAAQIGTHQSIKVFLGRLRSSDFSTLAVSRQNAIDLVWAGVMAPARIHADGTGSLSVFLND